MSDFRSEERYPAVRLFGGGGRSSFLWTGCGRPERQPRVARQEASSALVGPHDERNSEAAPREIAYGMGGILGG